jgi:hypothetical protein
MENIDPIDLLSKALGLPSENKDRLELYYPRILEGIIPLSFTGVTPRNFFSWKESGLIEINITDGLKGRKNVKLNLLEYVWVKAIQVMRDFGLSYSLIKDIKAILYSSIFRLVEDNILQFELGIKRLFIDEPEKGEDFMTLLRRAMDENIGVEPSIFDKSIEQSYLYAIIGSSILLNNNASIIIYRKDGDFGIGISQQKGTFLPDPENLSMLELPKLTIPIYPLIEGFFNEPKSERIAESFGLINPKEKKVLDAIREKDFLELHIKLDNNNELIIDAIKDGNVTDVQATNIRKILGLNSYEEVTLKYRNDKNLYFKNKKRL